MCSASRSCWPNGEIIRLGSRTHKNKTGFDLHRLFVGSEGMLGIVTEATLKLLPLPAYRAALSVGSEDMNRRSRHERHSGGRLSCLVRSRWPMPLLSLRRKSGLAANFSADCNAHLIIELDGQAAAVELT